MVDDVLAELKDTLAQLVAMDTTSVLSNRPLIEWAERRLTSWGFQCRRQSYTDATGVEKINLLAQKGEGRPELALVGHTDCVPFDSAWTEALTLVEKEGKLFGRGSCDTKAFLACALVAAQKTEPQKPLLLILTADEEIGCLGAKKLVAQGVGHARYAIVGEPTSLRPIRANKGYCLAEVEVFGKEGHSAYPDSGASAIFRASRFLRRLEEWATSELRTFTNPDFQPPFTTVNVGTIAGGKAKNIIPGKCTFTVEWRPIPNQSPDVVLKKLEALCQEMLVNDASFTARIKLLRQDAGVDTSLDSPLVQFLAQKTKRVPDTVSFGTEAPHLTQLGAQAVVFGPGNIQVAHQTGEFVPVDELLMCHQILVQAILHFCADGSAQP